MKISTKRLLMLYFMVFITTFNVSCQEKGNEEANSNDKKILVEILYMNHGPVQPILKAMRLEFEQFAGKAEFKWFDFDTDLEFKKMKGIDSHIPIVIWINNSITAKINDQEIKFSGFPSDEGPKFARGQWKVTDLVTAIKNAIGEKNR